MQAYYTTKAGGMCAPIMIYMQAYYTTKAYFTTKAGWNVPIVISPLECAHLL